MRSPAGQDHWTRGHIVEIVPDSRLVLDLHAVDANDKPFLAHFPYVAPPASSYDVP